MGILDDVQNSWNRGMAAAGRGTEKMKLENRLRQIANEREHMAAQLGANLYMATKDNPEMRQGREALYDGIAALDNEAAQCHQQISNLEAQAQAAQQAAMVYTCTSCGSTVSSTDMFCSVCGKSVAEIKAEVAAATQVQPQAAPVDGPKCPGCGAPVVAGDAFCMNCGAALNA